jgi:hypothetical protein
VQRNIPDPASPTDPPQDHPATTVPQCITTALHVVGILLDYGRHLLATVRHRAAAPTFPAIAACFGTANLSTILAHLNRGILRAAALERVLLACAANGRDIDAAVLPARTAKALCAPADIQAGQLSASPVPSKAATRPHPANRDDPELFMPTPEDLERQVRRRSLGRTIGEICLDLAVVPGFCTGTFWNDVFTLMWQFGGSVAGLMREKTRRREAFIREHEKKLDSTWDWLQLDRDAIRQILGFFIGEPPVDPFAAVTATGPP